MGKYEKKKEKKSKKGLIIAIVVIIVLALLALFVMPQVLYMISGEAEADESEQILVETTEATETPTEYSQDDALTFPYVLEDGLLEVENLFPFSGLNPDGGLQDVADVASLTLKNTSDQHLEAATIIATLQDGTQCTFAIADLPAGKSVMAFAAGNESLKQDGFCVDLSIEAVFTETPAWDQVSVSVVGTTVTLQNLTEEDLSNIDVYCHDTFGESYFGGITYKHTISNLAAGQTATIEVTDSVIGLIEVVRIAINES